MRPIFRIALRNAHRQRRRSLAVTVAVALGFAAVSLFQGFTASLRDVFEHQARHQLMLGDLLVKKALPPNTPPDRIPHFRLSRADQALVERVLLEHRESISGYMRKLFIGGLVTTGQATTHFFGMGYDVSRGAALRGAQWSRDTYAGEPLQEGGPPEAVLARQLGAIVDCREATGTAVSGALDCSSEKLELQALAANGRFSAVTVDIRGLFETGTRELGRKYLMTDLATAQSLFDTDEINGYSIAVTHPAYAPILRSALIEASDRAGAGLRIKPWQEFAEGAFYRSLMSLLGVFSGIVIAVTAAISAGAIFTLLSRTVTERVREIGTLRSLGYRGRHVLLMFAIEGCTIAIVGCVAGALVSAVLGQIIGSLGLTFTGGLASTPLPLAIRLEPGGLALTAGCLIGVATLAALLPARRAARITITDALAHA